MLILDHMRRSGTSGSEALHDLLTRALTPAGVPSKKGERKPNGGKNMQSTGNSTIL